MRWHFLATGVSTAGFARTFSHQGTHRVTIPAGVVQVAVTVEGVAVRAAPAGQTTVFDASASTVRYGTIATYAWDFGDSTTLVTTVPTAQHVYSAPGNRTVTVTETTSSGTSTTQVFTGHMMLRNGGPSAVATQSFAVP